MSANSVFSRLDYKPSVTAHRNPQRPVHVTAVSPVGKRRIINTKTSDSSLGPSRTVTSTSPAIRKISSVNPSRKIITTTTRESVRESDGVRPSSLPYKVLVKRLVETRTVGKRLGDRIGTTVSNPERRSGLFAYKGSSSTGGSRSRREVVSFVEKPSSAEVAIRSSMVADEYEYQTKRQRDIRSRLEVKELEKRARRGGPLVGRLDSHKVFRRLE